MRAAKKCTVILTMIAFIMSIMAVTAFAAADGIDWERGVVRATGMAAGKAGEKRINLAKAQARRAARMDAERNLAEQIKGVQVTAESSMKDLELEYDSVRTTVEALIKNMQEVGEPKFYDDGVCELVLEMPLFGAYSSVAEAAFIPFKDETKVAFPQPSVTTTTTTTTTTNTVVAGAMVENVHYTGLIVDCAGLDLKPVMSPVIKNNSGQPIYGHQNLDYDKVIELGMASYVKNANDVSAATRAGKNPIVVKALSVENHNANPIITISDADSILIANQGDHFLDNCAVVFVR